MKIKIITFGKIKDNNLKQVINEYLNRIKHFIDIEIIELNEEKIFNESNISNINISLQKESKLIEKYISNQNVNVLLDINSKELDSIEFCNFIKKNLENSKQINFFIGSSHGFSKDLKNKFIHKISFSKLTFNHQIFRLILLEQIYRSLTIMKNIKYHK